MKICIAGSGAMACLFAYKLLGGGYDATMLSFRDSRVKEINENGINICHENVKDHFNPTACRVDLYNEKPDYIILFVKAMQLKKMLDGIKKNIDSNTKVMCLINGLGHENTITKYVSEENILIGTTIWTSMIDKRGFVSFIDDGTVTYKCLNGPRDKNITQILNKSNLFAKYDQNVSTSIWAKAALNAATNPLCTLLDCNVGKLYQDEIGKNLAKNIVDEFGNVAKVENVDFDKKAVFDMVIDLSERHGAHYTSMHQDLIQNKRPTEIDYINGACVNLGIKHNIKCPYNDTITRLLKKKEFIMGVSPQA